MCLLLGGCSHEERFSVTWLDLFDTVCSFTAYCGSREEFDALAEDIHGELLRVHRLCDAYHEYEGMVNLCSLNARAGIEPLAVDGFLYSLLEDAAAYYELSGGALNAAMGSVLTLWHDAREEGTALPSDEALREASLHCGIRSLVLADGTVFFSDPELRLDLGALAKGSAAQHIFSRYPGSWLLNLGGTVAAKGSKPRGAKWQIAVSNAVDGGTLRTEPLQDGFCATSSDSQRYYTVDGVRYSHIIDPETLYPALRHRQVTVFCENGTTADALSTALFILPRDEGEALARRFGAEAIWL